MSPLKAPGNRCDRDVSFPRSPFVDPIRTESNASGLGLHRSALGMHACWARLDCWLMPLAPSLGSFWSWRPAGRSLMEPSLVKPLRNRRPRRSELLNLACARHSCCGSVCPSLGELVSASFCSGSRQGVGAGLSALSSLGTLLVTGWSAEACALPRHGPGRSLRSCLLMAASRFDMMRNHTGRRVRNCWITETRWLRVCTAEWPFLESEFLTGSLCFPTGTCNNPYMAGIPYKD